MVSFLLFFFVYFVIFVVKPPVNTGPEFGKASVERIRQLEYKERKPSCCQTDAIHSPVRSSHESASEFMTTRLESLDSESTVYDAVEKMVDLRIRSLLVRFPGGDMQDGVITATGCGVQGPGPGKGPE